MVACLCMHSEAALNAADFISHSQAVDALCIHVVDFYVVGM